MKILAVHFYKKMSAVFQAIVLFGALTTTVIAQGTDEPLTAIEAETSPQGLDSTADFGDWLVECRVDDTEARQCGMLQQALWKKEDKPVALMRFVITLDATEKRGDLSITLPLGVSLPEGAVITIDGRVYGSVPYSHCDNRGCYATQKLTAGRLEQFLRMTQGVVEMQDTKGNKLEIPLSGKGSRAAYNSTRS